jgi:cell fate regulator YaaT (PSP1 superfamily)
MSAGVFEALFGLMAESETSRGTPLAPIRVVRVAHEGRPGLHHVVRVPDGAHVVAGQRLVFEVPGDAAVGRAEGEPWMMLPPAETAEPMPVMKVMAADEVEAMLTNVSRREAEAFAWFRERVAALRLPMKPVHVEMSPVGGRFVFYYWSEHRVDFRTLLADLRKRIVGRIDLVQFGAHEAARHIGGIGRCQREFCNRVIPNYPAVSPKHARTQGLSPNPQKHLGTCNRLMMCLQHEQTQYVEARKGLPREGKQVDTPIGRGVVKELDILRGRVKVRTEDGEWGTFSVTELSKDGKPLVDSGPGTVDETIDREVEGDEYGGETGSEVPIEELPPELRPRKKTVLGAPREETAAAPAPAREAPPPPGQRSAPSPRVEGPRPRQDRPERPARPDRPDRPDRPKGGEPGQRPQGDRGPKPAPRPNKPAPQGAPPAPRPKPPAPARPAPPPRVERGPSDPEAESDDALDDGDDGPDDAPDTGGPEGGAPRKRRRRRRRGGGSGSGGAPPSAPQA